jgi:hypothetical protein
MSYFQTQKWLLGRRHFLRGVGATVALPMLEAMIPLRAFGKNELDTANRFVCVSNPFGMIADSFFPTEEGLAAALPASLAPMEGMRGKFTVFSHLDHGLSGGHTATHAFLSGVRSNEASAMRDGNITLDQRCGEHVAGKTRFPVLNTSAGSSNGGGVELSWTRAGVMVPSIQKVDQVFRMLFVDEAGGKDDQASRYDKQGSVLDAVNSQAKAMAHRLGKGDREKMDQYFTSVREVEKTIQLEKEWLSRPRPKVDMKEPQNGTVTQQIPVMFDLITLALQTDSTRVATLEIPGAFDAAGIGIEARGYHAYSHHGKDEAMLKGLRHIERYQMEQLARFMTKLGDIGLLNTTQILFGSGMSDGSAHTNKNLPVLVAGGNYQHRTHVGMPQEQSKRVPLSNLYLTMAQKFGIETDSFGASKSTLTEIG